MSLTQPILSISEFNRFAKLVYEKAGIHLKGEKLGLVQARIGKLLRQKKLPDYKAYLGLLENDVTGDELVDFIDAISTNVTHFFRENSHFEFITRQFMPEKALRIQSRQDSPIIRCWSAGCSRGHEPWSLAMTIVEAMEKMDVKWEVKILGTDISTRVLKLAQSGIYEKDQVSGVGNDRLRRFFEPTVDGRYRVVDSLHKMVSFRWFNLMKPFPFKNSFDFIFCRNVMIYFDTETQKNLVRKFHPVLRQDGNLFLGHCETLSRLDAAYSFVEASVYKKA